MSVSTNELTPDLDIQILNRLHLKVMEIGDKIPNIGTRVYGI